MRRHLRADLPSRLLASVVASPAFWAVVAIGLGLPTASCEARAAPAPRKKAVVQRAESSPPAAFAAADLAEALREAGYEVAVLPLEGFRAGAPAVRFRLEVSPEAGIPAEGFEIRVGEGGDYRVVGADARGVMYGGLDLAETIRLGGGLDEVAAKKAKPAVAHRGIKFNIPLDARTPSYDDSGDAAQLNIETVWDFSFWRELLDDLARDRYDTLTLWNPHPFPSLVRCPRFPDIALDDVCVTTLPLSGRRGEIGEPQFVTAEVLEHLKVVRRLPLGEKIAFWRKVLRHARDRGIDVYWITWNVCLNPVAIPRRLARPGKDDGLVTGKHGISVSQTNPKTVEYLRESVRELLVTYPELTGIGVTAGENMQDRDDENDREKWLWKTYGEGIVEARKQFPGREIRFLHRVWNSGMERIARDFAAHYPDRFEVGFKYARARLYATPRPPFARQLARDLRERGLRCWWNLRNDDIFCFRWGDPDYVRQFVKSFPEGVTAGFHLGSDGYVWGRQFISRAARDEGQLEIRKHWFAWLLWGRLGYDPSLERELFVRLLAHRYRGASAGILLDAWQAASRIIPRVNRFHWRNWDFMWAVEGCMDQRKGFHTVEDFISTPTLEGSGLVGVRELVAGELAGKPLKGTTPLEVADALEKDAARALSLADAVAASDHTRGQLLPVLEDIRAMAWLGRYYAAKIRGAVWLERFRHSARPEQREKAVERLEEAVGHWKAYARNAESRYRPQLLARTRRLDWHRLLDDVRRDVEIARGRPRPRSR